uniref:Alliinase C-terminal domain-containing protein n=1 Tax=Kalanchoe fedtschenkoi TaxID=63787 RepID=A0A7N0T5D9_KALFE
MGKDWNSAMYWRHLLVLSLAINIGMVAKVVLFHGDEKEVLLCPVEPGAEAAHLSRVVSEGSSLELEVASGVGDHGRVVDLDHGDPTMYEMFWKRMDEETTIVIPGWQSISYFSDPANPCWFLEPELAKQAVRIHQVVGNAVTENRYMVVGTGSTQLYQAALYALAPHGEPGPMDVVSVAPFYSSYPLMTDFLKSGLYKWAGDANLYDKDGPYIELVTSPNNPDGEPRTSAVNRSQGVLIHDFAYYWPQYAPITSAADHDLMLFTVSKSTGHAGSRIGWALVKDKEVAMKMTKFIELNTIGVSKDSQLRAAKILKATSDSCKHMSNPKVENFFKFSFNQMTERWAKLRAAVRKSGLFSLPDFTSDWCTYNQQVFQPQPAFAWLKCEGEIDDCQGFLKKHKILTRCGKHFGASLKYVRVNMLDRDPNFNLFVERLSTMSLIE